MPISASVAGAVVVLLSACVFSAFCAFRTAAGWNAGAGASWRWRLVAACGIALFCLGCRLCIAEGKVSWAPYLDQWNAEMSGTLSPLAHGSLTLREVFAGNNEHRVVLTRIASMVAVAANGAWDNRVMVMATFLLQSAAVAWVFLLGWSALGWFRGSLVGAAALLPMFLVCDWENIVSGFQDQFGFMVLGSVVAFSLLGDDPAWARRGALVIALIMLGTMASGLLTGCAMAAAFTVVAFAARRWRPRAGFIAACAAIAAFGWLTRHPFAPLPSLYAQGPGAWLSAFLAYGAWPLPPTLAGFACLWLPWCSLLAWILGKREAPTFSRFVIALGTWVLLQAGVLAWSRAGLSGLVSARYTEVLGWGFVANASAAAVLIAALRIPLGARIAMVAAAAIWFGATAATEAWRSRAVYRPYFESFRSQTREHEERLEKFMSTGDASVIESVSFPHIPGTADEIVRLLQDPKVQPLLPGPLRRDLDRRKGIPESGLRGDGPLGKAAAFALRSGPWFASAGIAVLLAGLFFARRRRDSGESPASAARRAA
jgi:hypothetical protein